MLVVGNACCALNAGQQNETTKPPYGVEEEQDAVRQQATNEHATTGQVDADAPTEVQQATNSHAHQPCQDDAGKVARVVVAVHENEASDIAHDSQHIGYEASFPLAHIF